MSTTSKFFAYCFTINNYTPEDDDQLKALEKNKKIRYLIFGREVGESGTPHYQGYVYFHSRVVFPTIQKLLTRAFITPAKGSVEQNVNYCSKGGDFYESGDKPMSQKRKGECGAEYWSEQLSLAKRGKVEECDPKLQITHHSALYAIAARHSPMPVDNDVIDNHWYYGETGSGKSFKARSENPGAYLKMCN